MAAFVVSLVADAAKAAPPVLVHAITSVSLVVQSPDRLPLLIDVPPVNLANLPLAGDPVVVTEPPPDPPLVTGYGPNVPVIAVTV